jgi:hypothetical protein
VNWSLFGWIVAFVLALGGSAFAWLWFAGGSGEPSTELTTPIIVSESETTSSTSAQSTTSEDASTSTTSSGTEPIAFVIDPERSTASFEIDEEFQGAPKRVVGTTSQVAGQVLVDTSDLTTAQFSEIVINARTFETDSSRRDRAIRGPVILNSASDEFEFITFSVRSVEGLQGTMNLGDTIELMVSGELTVKGTANVETFVVTATLVDQTTIEGAGTTNVSRETYGIGIPSVPGVANVGDAVELNLVFVMTAS